VASPKEACRACGHFRNDPAYLERSLTGIASLGSPHASVRSDDGLCSRHQRYRDANAWCADFRPRAAAS
jgi:hypothetical protein